MNLIEIIFLAGTHCVSPLQVTNGITEASKVACAVVVKQDQKTTAVQIFPTTAATNPQIIAVLGKSASSGSAPAVPSKTLDPYVTAKTISNKTEKVTGSASKPASAVAVPATHLPMAKPRKSKDTAGLTVGKKKTAVRKPRDKCGSYKAVWYTNKEGRRKYRCVRR